MGRFTSYAVLAGLLVALWAPSVAQAGGFYLLPRGARANAQGGAVIAGADAPDALWFNPAGLAYSGKQLMMDFTLPIQHVSYTRVNSGGETEPTVDTWNAPLPLPGFGYSDNFGLEKVTFGVGLFAPTAALHTWPRYVDDGFGNEIGAPTRYTALSMEGSGFGMINVGLAYRPIPQLSIGATFTGVVGRFVVDIVMSTCDNGLLCGQPEAEKWDAAAQIVVPWIFSPTGGVGMILDIAPVKFGISAALPFKLEGEAQFKANLPAEQVFAGAELTNDKADFEAAFPLILRTGLEVRPIKDLRMELQFTWEQWSVQDAMKVAPKDIAIEGAIGFDRYEVGNIEMKRGLNDVFAIGLGTEYDITRHTTLMGGVMLEKGSLKDEYMTVLTPDTDKLQIGAGVTYELLRNIFIEFTGGWLHLKDRHVTNSKLFAPSPLRPPPPEDTDNNFEPGEAVPLGNGTYKLEAGFVAFGVKMVID